MDRAAIDKLRAEIPVYQGLLLEEKDIRAFRVTELVAGEYDKKRGGYERYICEAERAERQKHKIRTSETGYTIPPAVFRGNRNIIFGTDADGGYLVDDNTVPMAFAHYLYTKSVVIPRSTMLMDMKGTLSIGQETGKTSVVWGNEVSTATESQSAFGVVNLSPKELKVLTKVSKFLMMQSDPSAENLTRMCMMASFAEAFDNKILYGTGSSEVTGLNQLDRIDTDPHDGRISLVADAALARSDLTPALSKIGKANASGNLDWLTGWDFYAKACELYGLVEDGKIFGIPVEASRSVADDDAWLGNWEYLVTAVWGGIDIQIDTTSLLHKQICRIVGHYRVDSGALHEDAFVQVTEA